MTAGDEWPAQVTGFRADEQRARLGHGSERWVFASEAVLRWGVKTRSGFTVEDDTGRDATDRPVEVGDRCRLAAHLGPMTIREPIQVVRVIDEPDRQGFAYGTLSGHPLSGEEAFVVERLPDGSVWLTVRSVTQPARGHWRWAHPAVRVAQRVYRGRYLRALAGPI